MAAISAPCRSPFTSGSPLTTMYESPIVSTLYTSYFSMMLSNVLQHSGGSQRAGGGGVGRWGVGACVRVCVSALVVGLVVGWVRRWVH